MTGSAASSNKNVVTMRRPDGSFMTKKEVIVIRRGAFKWTPVLCSNDLVHGSWWFVAGSIGFAITSIIPLINIYMGIYVQEDDLLPQRDFDITWSLLVASATFYTLGSGAFVRAFEEPPKQALFHNWKHLQNDELLGAWLFLLGTAPTIPYCLVFYWLHAESIYLAGCAACIIGTFGCALFVLGCYPSDVPAKVDNINKQIAELECSKHDKDSTWEKKCSNDIRNLKREIDKLVKTENYVLPVLVKWFGSRIWMARHLSTDFLAACWFFFWGNLLMTIFSFGFLIAAFIYSAPSEVMFIYVSGFLNSFLFLVGAMYYVAGSYPNAQHFFYAVERRTSEITLSTSLSATTKLDLEERGTTARGYSPVRVKDNSPGDNEGDDVNESEIENQKVQFQSKSESVDDLVPLEEAVSNPVGVGGGIPRTDSAGLQKKAEPSSPTRIGANSQSYNLSLDLDNAKTNKSKQQKQLMSSSGIKTNISNHTAHHNKPSPSASSTLASTAQKATNNASATSLSPLKSVSSTVIDRQLFSERRDKSSKRTSLATVVKDPKLLASLHDDVLDDHIDDSDDDDA